MNGNAAPRQSPLEEFSEDELQRINRDLEGSSPTEILRWAAEHFGPRFTFATGFGPEGCAIINMVAQEGLNVDLFTLDTGLFFTETHDLWKQLEAHTGLTIRGVQPDTSLPEQSLLHGEELWKTNPDLCCTIRKVLPLKEALTKFDAWASAIRRDQTPDRANTPIVSYDSKFGLVKVSPLAAWSSEDVWNYLKEHNVPVNSLHAEGFPSIGCAPCTSPVKPGEDPRAGRWRSHQKTECGLHTGNRHGNLRIIQGDAGTPIGS